MNFLQRLKMHVKVGVLFSVCATLLVSAQQDKLTLDHAGLLVGLATIISLGFAVGAFLSPCKYK